jgi:hypothetical protein
LADPTRLLLYVQLGIQIVLVGFVVFLLVLEKKRKTNPDVLDGLKEVVKQTQDLSATFHEQLQQKVNLITKVSKDLDEKIRASEQLMKALEETSLRVKKARQFTPADIQKLHKGGFDPEEISQITGIPIGEIQLMVKFANQNTA